MAAPRFFTDAALAAGTVQALPAAVAHHALRVLRLRDGDTLTLFNGRGGEYRARLLCDGAVTRAAIDSFDPVERESPLAVTLIQAWIASDKLDWSLEKAVELGVHRVLVCPAERSVVRLAGDRQARRLAHLRGVAVSACEQCGRNRVPEIAAPGSLADALAAVSGGPAIVLDPAAPQPLAAFAQGARDLALMVGPEGGFTPAERALAQQLGVKTARLGPRVLRTETAGVAALAALQATAGDLMR